MDLVDNLPLMVESILFLESGGVIFASTHSIERYVTGECVPNKTELSA